MRPRALVLVAILVVGLGAFIWFFERDLPSTEERRELSGRIVPVEIDDIDAVVVESDGERVRLERSATGEESIVERSWRVAAPVSAPADVDKVESLLRQLTMLEKERTVEAVEPTTVGLDQPRQRIVLETSDDREMLLEVGGDVPATHFVVLRLDGDGVFVTDGSFRDQIETVPGEWRSRDLLDFDERDVSKIAASGSFGEITIVREDGRYLLESPIADEADQDAVSDLIAALDDLSVLEFVETPLDESSSGVAPPQLVVTLEIAGHEPTVLRFGSIEEKEDEESEARYLSLADRLYLVSTNLWTLFSRPMSEWRSTAWTSLEPFEVESLVIRQGGDTTALERRGAEWLRDGEPIAYADVADLLDVVSDLSASSVLAREEVEEDAAEEVEIELSGSEKSNRLRLLRASSGEFFAFREGRDVALSVAEEEVAELLGAIATIGEAAGRDMGSSLADERSNAPGS
jgi:hypothetical protein